MIFCGWGCLGMFYSLIYIKIFRKMVANEVAEKVLIESDDKQLGDKAEALPDEHDVSDQFQRLNLYFDEHVRV